MKNVLLHSALLSAAILGGCAQTDNTDTDTSQTLTALWDKTFELDPQIHHEKITFKNRYGITIAADLYRKKDGKSPYSAIAVSGPFGAVKEQSSGLYAQEMAKRGYLAIAFDPSFTGESSGFPRNVASPDINTEDFQAAVDYLSSNKDVDKDKIGIIGICGFGGFSISAAINDSRIKAVTAVTMYDMSRVTANGYFDKENTKEQRNLKRKAISEQRTLDYKNGEYKRAGGVPDKIPDDAPQFVKDYYAYYKTKRGYHERSLNSNEGWNVTSFTPFLNLPINTYADEIDSAVLLVHGENAHSRYFSEDLFKHLKGDNKFLEIVKGANHTDLYDNMDKIPFDKIDEFFKKHL